MSSLMQFKTYLKCYSWSRKEHKLRISNQGHSRWLMLKIVNMTVFIITRRRRKGRLGWSFLWELKTTLTLNSIWRKRNMRSIMISPSMRILNKIIKLSSHLSCHLKVFRLLWRKLNNRTLNYKCLTSSTKEPTNFKIASFLNSKERTPLNMTFLTIFRRTRMLMRATLFSLNKLWWEVWGRVRNQRS